MSNVIDLSKPFASVFEALDLKQQRKALKGAMRKAANVVKRYAVEDLQNSGLGQGTLTPIEKGISARVYPDRYGTGFLIGVLPKNGKGLHVNRQMLEKPILMWAEEGTRPRRNGNRVSAHKGTSRLTGRRTKYYKRDGGYRGSMKAYHFMKKTELRDTGEVEDILFKQLQKNIDKAAQKLGLL